MGVACSSEVGGASEEAWSSVEGVWSSSEGVGRADASWTSSCSVFSQELKR